MNRVLPVSPELQEMTEQYLGFYPWDTSGHHHSEAWAEKYNVEEDIALYLDLWWSYQGLGIYKHVLPLYLPVGRDIAARWIAKKLGLDTGLGTAPHLILTYNESVQGIRWLMCCGEKREWLPGPHEEDLTEALFIAFSMIEGGA